MRYADFGNRHSPFGWELEYIIPAWAAAHDPDNLQALHWKAAAARSEHIAADGLRGGLTSSRRRRNPPPMARDPVRQFHHSSYHTTKQKVARTQRQQETGTRMLSFEDEHARRSPPALGLQLTALDPVRHHLARQGPRTPCEVGRRDSKPPARHPIPACAPKTSASSTPSTDVNQLVPFKYKWAWDKYLSGCANHWMPQEINMNRDIARGRTRTGSPTTSGSS